MCKSLNKFSHLHFSIKRTSFFKYLPSYTTTFIHILIVKLKEARNFQDDIFNDFFRYFFSMKRFASGFEQRLHGSICLSNKSAMTVAVCKLKSIFDRKMFARFFVPFSSHLTSFTSLITCANGKWVAVVVALKTIQRKRFLKLCEFHLLESLCTVADLQRWLFFLSGLSKIDIKKAVIFLTVSL